MNKAMWVLLAIGAGGSAAALHLTAQLRETRAENAKLQARVAELERAAPRRSPFASDRPTAEPAPARTGQVEARPSGEAKAPPAALMAGVIAPPAAIHAPAPQPNREQATRQMRAHMERERALLNDPEYREAMLLQHKAMLPHQYPDLAAELQLSAEETDRFMSLLADQQLRSREVFGIPFDPSATPAEREAQQQKAQAWQKTIEAEIKAELGPDKWSAWQDYQSTMGVRYQVRELNQALAAQGAALDQSQLTSLRQALASAEKQHVEAMSRSASQMRAAAMAEPRTARQADWLESNLKMQKDHQRRIREAASAVLNSEQLKVLEERQNAQLRIQEAHLKMARAQAEAEARGETPPSSNMFFSGSSFIVSESTTY